MANVDNALPALRLTIPIPLTDGGTRFEANPLEVTKHHAAPWICTWKANASDFVSRLGNNFQKLRSNFLEEASETADESSYNPGVVRKALKCFRRKTAIGADDMTFKLLADLPDVALDKLGLLCKQSNGSLSLPIQQLVTLCVII